jgi:hypothetical protein
LLSTIIIFNCLNYKLQILVDIKRKSKAKVQISGIGKASIGKVAIAISFKLFLFSGKLEQVNVIRIREIHLKVGPDHNAWSSGQWKVYMVNNGKECLTNGIE